LACGPAHEVGLHLGAIYPEHGKGAGLVLSFHGLAFCRDITPVAPGAHAMVLIDQAGWHTTGKIEVPDNISIIALPAKCPELNPVENIWQFMRENWLPNRIFRPCDTSSTTAVMPGTSLSISPGTS